MIYLIFNEGYAATAGDDWMRPALCGEAQRLVRVLARLAPDGPEVQGLVALLEIQVSRLPVLLMDQDRARWAPCWCAGAWGRWRWWMNWPQNPACA